MRPVRCSKCGLEVSGKPEKAENRVQRDDGGSDHLACTQPPQPKIYRVGPTAERLAERHDQRAARRLSILRGEVLG